MLISLPHRGRRLLYALIGLLLPSTALLTAVAAPPPVHAGGGFVVSPAQDAFVPRGFDGPIVLDTTAYAGQTLHMRVQCDFGADYLHLWDFLAVGGQEPFTIPSIDVPTGTHCVIEGWDEAWNELPSSAFDVSSEYERLDLYASLPFDTFYPFVDDGYRDGMKLRYAVSMPSTLTLRITNPAGKTVRAWTWHRTTSAIGTLTWNGRDEAGRPVPAGDYRLRLSAIDDERQRTRTRVRTAHAATGFRTIRHELTQGVGRMQRATHGACYIQRSAGRATLDCYGGDYARGTFVLPVPSGARRVRWEIQGRPAPTDLCCHGRITKQADRTRNRLHLIVQVSGTRAYVVRGAAVSFQTRRAI